MSGRDDMFDERQGAGNPRLLTICQYFSIRAIGSDGKLRRSMASLGLVDVLSGISAKPPGSSWVLYQAISIARSNFDHAQDFLTTQHFCPGRLRLD